MAPHVAAPSVHPSRLAELACRLSSASVTTNSWVTVADVAVAELAGLVPDAGAAVAVRTRHPEYLRPVAVANMPHWPVGRRLPIGAAPLLTSALKSSDRVVHARDLRAIGIGHNGGPVELLCAAVPARASANILVTLLAPNAESVRDELAQAIDIVRSLLAVLMESPIGRPSADPLFHAIRRAKREWEHAADALPVVLGLLGRDGRVLRVNRAIERAAGLPVRQARGRTLHDALHPTCRNDGCGLAATLREAWSDVLTHGAVEAEFEDTVNTVDWHIHLLRTNGRTTAADPTRVSSAAFAITEVTPLRRARRLLQEANSTLERRVMERTGALTKANVALRDEIDRRLAAEASLRNSRNELQQLADQRVQLQEQERKRIADDLHDAVGQSLSAIKYSLERAMEHLVRPSLGPVGPVLEGAVARVQRVVDEVRMISMNLRPSVLDQFGAASAARWLCREWSTVYAGIDLMANIEVEDGDIPPELATTVFRTIQESLNNIAKHADASQVIVTIRRIGDNVELRVQDDGRGFQPIALTGSGIRSHGLRSMRERAERVGGRFVVLSAPGRGTTVEVAWPLASDATVREATCIN